MKLEKVLLLGSGALKIGEAGEFDYSGTQAIKALKEEGVKVILVNPNVATIQTSAGLADTVYFLPVTPEFVEKIIARERPQGILLSFGGQTALNCGIALYIKKVFEKFKVEILGTPIRAIIDTEDREKFSTRLNKIGLKTAAGLVVTDESDGLKEARKLGYPVMVRSGFALGGTGSGISKTPRQLAKLLRNALAVSPHAVVEECLTGWKEVEYEVVRDRADNCITVCNMENVDPVGIHTGESIVVAPSQTLNHEEYYTLRQVAIDTIRELAIIGECNIQFAINPQKFDYRIIEVNARLSRSSALASKATGYPLAYVAAKLALGFTLPELTNKVTGKTSAFFEPALDYITVKAPRWDLDKFVHVDAKIGSEMKSVGEVMSIARTFEEAIQKAARMLNDGYEGVIDARFSNGSKKKLMRKLTASDSMRLFTICTALEEGVTAHEICALTGIDRWFIERLAAIVKVYKQLKKGRTLNSNLLLTAKKYGFSDKQIADIRGESELAIRRLRQNYRITPFVKRIDTLAGEFPAITNYLYVTYGADAHDYIPSRKEKKVIVVGCGPYAIGTSVEFDWCAVSTVNRLKKHRLGSIIINCNPETVSTDYDISDYLYFEELTFERIMDIWELERSPLVLSVGGQIPNNLAQKLYQEKVPILGTKPTDIFKAENRQQFSKILDTLGIWQPKWGKAISKQEAKRYAHAIGFPILVRPSFVLSGKRMAVIESDTALDSYMDSLDLELKEFPLVITQFLDRVTECDFDGVAQKGSIVIWALSEHIESGGVHSGDSTLMLPAVTLSPLSKRLIYEAARKIVRKLAIDGPFNIQYLVQEETPYVIECNVRASRSFPYVSKVLAVNFIDITTDVLLGKKVPQIDRKDLEYQAVKVPQFSYHKLRGADPVVKVEMNSTGEVSAFGRDIFEAYLSALLATGISYPKKKTVFLSLGGINGKLHFLKGAQLLSVMGYTIYSTAGTAIFLRENNIQATKIAKIYESGRPDIRDLLLKKQIDFCVVIPESYADRGVKAFQKTFTDGYIIRRLAVDMGVPVFSNVDAAKYFVEALYRYPRDKIQITSWQEYSKNRFERSSI